MCPLCGRPLNTVDREPQALRERAFMQTLIDQCKSKEEIKAALKAQFGDEVLALPEGGGFDLTAYIVPVLVPLAALAAIVLTATRWRRRRSPGAPATATGGGSDRPGRTHRHSTPTTRPAWTRTWSATSCDRAGAPTRRDRHDRLRRVRRRLPLVRLPLRAAARPGLPVDDLRRRLGRHRGGPQEDPHPDPGADLLRVVLADVHPARADGDRHRPDAAGQPRAAPPDLRAGHRRDGRVLHRDAVRAGAEPRVPARRADEAREHGRPDPGRHGVRRRVAALHGRDARRGPAPPPRPPPTPARAPCC